MKKILSTILLLFLYLSVLGQCDDMVKFASDTSGPSGQALREAVDAEPALIDAWNIVKEGPDLIRTNLSNLQKLNDFIAATGMEKSKLVNSFANTSDPQKWLDLKLTQNQLDDTFTQFMNDPPSNHVPWTKEHKASRWKNYEEGSINGENSGLDFNSWSNGYDGKIDLVTNANQAVDDFLSTLDWGCSPPSSCREVFIPNITAVLDGEVITAGRRLDIANLASRSAKEFKEYAGGKVYNSFAIRKEVALDKKLLQDGDLINNIEWVFKGCTPSQPLQQSLTEAGILFNIIN